MRALSGTSTEFHVGRPQRKNQRDRERERGGGEREREEAERERALVRFQVFAVPSFWGSIQSGGA